MKSAAEKLASLERKLGCQPGAASTGANSSGGSSDDISSNESSESSGSRLATSSGYSPSYVSDTETDSEDSEDVSAFPAAPKNGLASQASGQPTEEPSSPNASFSGSTRSIEDTAENSESTLERQQNQRQSPTNLTSVSNTINHILEQNAALKQQTPPYLENSNAMFDYSETNYTDDGADSFKLNGDNGMLRDAFRNVSSCTSSDDDDDDQNNMANNLPKKLLSPKSASQDSSSDGEGYDPRIMSRQPNMQLSHCSVPNDSFSESEYTESGCDSFSPQRKTMLRNTLSNDANSSTSSEGDNDLQMDRATPARPSNHERNISTDSSSSISSEEDNDLQMNGVRVEPISSITERKAQEISNDSSSSSSSEQDSDLQVNDVRVPPSSATPQRNTQEMSNSSSSSSSSSSAQDNDIQMNDVRVVPSSSIPERNTHEMSDDASSSSSSDEDLQTNDVRVAPSSSIPNRNQQEMSNDASSSSSSEEDNDMQQNDVRVVTSSSIPDTSAREMANDDASSSSSEEENDLQIKDAAPSSSIPESNTHELSNVEYSSSSSEEGDDLERGDVAQISTVPESNTRELSSSNSEEEDDEDLEGVDVPPSSAVPERMTPEFSNDTYSSSSSSSSEEDDGEQIKGGDAAPSSVLPERITRQFSDDAYSSTSSEECGDEYLDMVGATPSSSKPDTNAQTMHVASHSRSPGPPIIHANSSPIMHNTTQTLERDVENESTESRRSDKSSSSADSVSNDPVSKTLSSKHSSMEYSYTESYQDEITEEDNNSNFFEDDISDKKPAAVEKSNMDTPSPSNLVSAVNESRVNNASSQAVPEEFEDLAGRPLISVQPIERDESVSNISYSQSDSDGEILEVTKQTTQTKEIISGSIHPTTASREGASQTSNTSPFDISQAEADGSRSGRSIQFERTANEPREVQKKQPPKMQTIEGSVHSQPRSILKKSNPPPPAEPEGEVEPIETILFRDSLPPHLKYLADIQRKVKEDTAGKHKKKKKKKDKKKDADLSAIHAQIIEAQKGDHHPYGEGDSLSETSFSLSENDEDQENNNQHYMSIRDMDPHNSASNFSFISETENESYAQNHRFDNYRFDRRASNETTTSHLSYSTNSSLVSGISGIVSSVMKNVRRETQQEDSSSSSGSFYSAAESEGSNDFRNGRNNKVKKSGEFFDVSLENPDDNVDTFSTNSNESNEDDRKMPAKENGAQKDDSADQGSFKSKVFYFLSRTFFTLQTFMLSYFFVSWLKEDDQEKQKRLKDSNASDQGESESDAEMEKMEEGSAGSQPDLDYGYSDEVKDTDEVKEIEWTPAINDDTSAGEESQHASPWFGSDEFKKEVNNKKATSESGEGSSSDSDSDGDSSDSDSSSSDSSSDSSSSSSDNSAKFIGKVLRSRIFQIILLVLLLGAVSGVLVYFLVFRKENSSNENPSSNGFSIVSEPSETESLQGTETMPNTLFEAGDIEMDATSIYPTVDYEDRGLVNSDCDDMSQSFFWHGTKRDCDWLAASRRYSRSFVSLLCDEGAPAREICSKTCGLC